MPRNRYEGNTTVYLIKQVGRMWAGLIWLVIGTSGGVLLTQ
jgi:hypothetical protein